MLRAASSDQGHSIYTVYWYSGSLADMICSDHFHIRSSSPAQQSWGKWEWNPCPPYSYQHVQLSGDVSLRASTVHNLKNERLRSFKHNWISNDTSSSSFVMTRPNIRIKVRKWKLSVFKSNCDSHFCFYLISIIPAGWSLLQRVANRVEALGPHIQQMFRPSFFSHDTLLPALSALYMYGKFHIGTGKRRGIFHYIFYFSWEPRYLIYHDNCGGRDQDNSNSEEGILSL